MVTLWSQATTMPREHSSPLPRRSGYRRRRSRTPQRERLTSKPSSRRHVEGALSSLLEDLPDPMIEAILGLGVETCVDFSHMWSSTRECVAELARLMGCDGFDEGIVKKLNRKLKAAQSEAQFQMEDAIKQVVQERRSSVATSPARSSSSHPVKAPPVPPPSNRIRPLQVAGGGDVGVRVVPAPCRWILTPRRRWPGRRSWMQSSKWLCSMSSTLPSWGSLQRCCKTLCSGGA